MKDFVADTCFDRGWRSVERHFNRLRDAAEHVSSSEAGGPGNGDIIESLTRLSSKVDIFADNWEHFHLRIEALLREYDLMHLLEDEGAGREGRGS
jgi:hypothetical protein